MLLVSKISMMLFYGRHVGHGEEPIAAPLGTTALFDADAG
jgi:hypothetical protein